MTSGPIAIPRFPPVEKMLMPVARRSPEASAAARAPSGWNAATPRPWNATAAAMSGYVGATPARPMPIPEAATPTGTSHGEGFRSAKYPKSGWTTDDAIVAARTRPPAAA